jgi:'Cold-shock' DNA-binding domain
VIQYVPAAQLFLPSRRLPTRSFSSSRNSNAQINRLSAAGIHPTQMAPPRTHVIVAPTSGLERAQVKWFNRLRGFGFLTRGEGTLDIFVH